MHEAGKGEKKSSVFTDRMVLIDYDSYSVMSLLDLSSRKTATVCAWGVGERERGGAQLEHFPLFSATGNGVMCQEEMI